MNLSYFKQNLWKQKSNCRAWLKASYFEKICMNKCRKYFLQGRSKGLRPTAEANVNGWMVAWLYSVELGGNYLSLNDSFFVPLAFFSRLMLIFSYSLSNQISILMSNTLHPNNVNTVNIYRKVIGIVQVFYRSISKSFSLYRELLKLLQVIC